MRITKQSVRRLIRLTELRIIEAGSKRAEALKAGGSDVVQAETQRVLCAELHDLRRLVVQ